MCLVFGGVVGWGFVLVSCLVVSLGGPVVLFVVCVILLFWVGFVVLYMRV